MVGESLQGQKKHLIILLLLDIFSDFQALPPRMGMFWIYPEVGIKCFRGIIKKIDYTVCQKGIQRE